MSRDTLDRQTQDFLDDRLSERDRSEFEARLARDRDLARRVEEYHELRRALRGQSPAELPPGFHRRARARFESAHRRRGRFPRILSWEAAGLAAAAIVLAVVFLPDQLRRDDEGRRNTREPVLSEGPEIPEPPPETALPGVRVRRDDREMQATRESETVPEEAVQQPAARIPERPVPTAEDRREAPPPSDRDRAVEEGRPLSDPVDRPPAPDRVDSLLGGAAPREKKQAERYGLASPAALEDASVKAVRSVRLPEGVLPREEVDIVTATRQEAWKALLDGPAGPALGDLEVDFSRERVVLIGPGGLPPDCSMWLDETAGGELWIRLGPKSLGEEPGGCAVVIPDGPARVRVARNR